MKVACIYRLLFRYILSLFKHESGLFFRILFRCIFIFTFQTWKSLVLPVPLDILRYNLNVKVAWSSGYSLEKFRCILNVKETCSAVSLQTGEKANALFSSPNSQFFGYDVDDVHRTSGHLVGRTPRLEDGVRRPLGRCQNRGKFAGVLTVNKSVI